MKIQSLPGFYAAGISARTTNAIESTDQSRIAPVWTQFIGGDPARVLTNRIGDDIYAVYTDYESDHTGGYIFVLGYQVSSLVDLPQGITGVEVPAGDYAVLTCAQGNPADVVPALWRQIWSLTPDELNGTRAFQADFERYRQGAAIEILIGLR